jgi:hypothetical protein
MQKVSHTRAIKGWRPAELGQPLVDLVGLQLGPVLGGRTLGGRAVTFPDDLANVTQSTGDETHDLLLRGETAVHGARRVV